MKGTTGGKLGSLSKLSNTEIFGAEKTVGWVGIEKSAKQDFFANDLRASAIKQMSTPCMDYGMHASRSKRIMCGLIRMLCWCAAISQTSGPNPTSAITATLGG